MNEYYRSLFNRPPIEIVNGDYYFGSDNEGDQFDEVDAELWLSRKIWHKNMAKIFIVRSTQINTIEFGIE